jgi:NADPH:quinone reductase-like Zn-dependent oxidoreductase
MPTAIRLTRTGGPEVLPPETVEQAEPGPHDAWIAREAVGVTYQTWKVAQVLDHVWRHIQSGTKAILQGGLLSSGQTNWK